MTAEESSTADEKMPPNEAEVAASTAASKMDPETEPLNAGGDPKVKFIGGDETVDVEKGDLAKKEEVKGALTKAELMKYATDKKWVATRWALFILFWICWLAMLVASVVIIIQAPKCPSPEPKQWWQKSPVYEVNVKSFKDSNGDGKGDLAGVASKVDYLKGLGVGSVYLADMLKSQSPKEIDPTYGTMEEFDNLLESLHADGLKVIMDFMPKLNEQQPDSLEVLQFWVDKGVDGFRLDSVANAASGDEVIELLKKYRSVLDEASKDEASDPKIMMTTEADLSKDDLTRYYGNIADQIGDITHVPMNFDLISDFETPDSFSATALKESLEGYTAKLPVDAWPNYCLGGHEYSRVASRIGSSRVNAMNMILMLLQGTPLTYNGEEIGMTDGKNLMDWTQVDAKENLEDSSLKIYRQMTNLRENEAILFGATNITVVDNTFVLSRVKKGNPGYLLISNFAEDGSDDTILNLQGIPNIAERGVLDIVVPKSDLPALAVGNYVDLAKVSVPPNVSLLISFVPKFS